MNIFLGIDLSDAIKRLKNCEDEKAAAVDIADFVCQHFVREEKEGINNLTEHDIFNAFDIMIAKLYADADLKKAELDVSFTQDDLVKISKAGNYVRYAAYDLIKALKAYYAGEPADFKQVMYDAIDRKVEEDTIDPATEEEVDQLINETEDIMSDVEENDEDGGNESVSSSDDGTSGVDGSSAE